jgi:hypothetical protein
MAQIVLRIPFVYPSPYSSYGSFGINSNPSLGAFPQPLEYRYAGSTCHIPHGFDGVEAGELIRIIDFTL